MFCATDLHFQDNHMRALRQTHPKAWRVVMRKGMAAEIRKLQRYFRDPSITTPYDYFTTNELIDLNSAAFDTLKHWTNTRFGG